jgi:tight adherence protein C
VSPAIYGLLASLAVAVGLCAVPGLLDRGPIERLGERIGEDAPGRKSLLRGLVERLAARLGPRVAPTLRASRRERIARQLDLAGRPGDLSVQGFVGIKAALLTLIGGLFALFALLGSSPLLLLLAAVLGWWGPDVWLSRLGRLRQEKIQSDLPDFMDILAVTVRAGLGYRSALRRVAESLGGPTGEEMITALRQMDLGSSRREAFLALRDRNSSESLASFVTAQLQAEELGVPLAEALNDIATDMRRQAHQEARQRAQRAVPRVSLIVTTLIVPGAIILIMTAVVLGSGLLEGGLFG